MGVLYLLFPFAMTTGINTHQQIGDYYFKSVGEFIQVVQAEAAFTTYRKC
jgi:hypothetical protein